MDVFDAVELSTCTVYNMYNTFKLWLLVVLIHEFFSFPCSLQCIYVGPAEVASAANSGPPDLPFTCVTCGERSPTLAQHRVHERSHTGNFPHYCNHCKRGFLNKTQYEGHMNKHLGLRPHLCQICNKGFRVRSDCTRHERCIHGFHKSSTTHDTG